MEIMIFPDFPTCTKTSFVHHTVVLEYLQHYAEKFDLYQYIQVSYYLNLFKLLN